MVKREKKEGMQAILLLKPLLAELHRATQIYATKPTLSISPIQSPPSWMPWSLMVMLRASVMRASVMLEWKRWQFIWFYQLSYSHRFYDTFEHESASQGSLKSTLKEIYTSDEPWSISFMSIMINLFCLDHYNCFLSGFPISTLFSFLPTHFHKQLALY